MATAAQICKNACYESNITAPSSFYGSTDPAALQLLHLYYAVGRELRQAKCWPQLKRVHTITTVSDDTTYSLPSDFYASTLDTFWDQTNQRRVLGPATDSEFNQLLYGVTTVNEKAYRIFGLPGTQQIQILPTPGDDDVLSFEYISKNWIYDVSAEAFVEEITADADSAVFDDDLMTLGVKAFLQRAKGMEYQQLLTDFRERIATAEGRFQGYRLGRMGARAFVLQANLPDGNFG